MGVTLVALEIDAADPARLAAFWAELLGRTADPGGTRLLRRSETDFEVWFVRTELPWTGLHRMHADLTSCSADDQRHTVELALRLGAGHLDVGQRGDEGHVVLADPEGNEFCVIEAGNQFLADTARIGGMAGDGTRLVGEFWSAALHWPLVWDHGQETAIQSPSGGTKLTWGGPPVNPKHARNRLRWVLAADHDLDAEIGRLRDLGAPVLTATAERAELADPDGNEFVVQPPARRPPAH